MRFAVLGPLAMHDDAGVRIEPPAPRLRVLLVALLLQPNAPVSAETLADAVWDGAPPPAAVETLRSYIRRLRRALGPAGAARIEARDPGYLIRVRPAELDVLEFEDWCRQADAALRRRAWAQAGVAAGRAMDLWRGAPLLDVPSQVLRDGCVPRLEQLRLQALEDRAEAELNQAGHAALVPQLRELAGEYPLRERFHAQLMLALYRAGRQAEALEAYRTARRALAQELGVEPGPELRGLHERILAGDAALLVPEHPELPGQSELPQQFELPEPPEPPGQSSVPALRTAARPAPWPHLVGGVPGRALGFQERAEALRLRQALEGAGTAVVGQVLSGLGGVGKTQLAANYARTAFTDGRLDVSVWVNAVSRLAILDGYTRAAVELLGVEPDEYAAQRFLAWLAPAVGRPVCRWLVVLDDVADPADLAGLWPPDSAHGRVVVTTRRRDAALTGPGRRRVEVGVFTPAEAAAALHEALAERDHPAQPSGQIEALAAELGFLPLAVSQAAAYIADAGVEVAAYRARLADRANALADLVPHPGRGQPDRQPGEPPDRDALPDEQAATVAATWSLSLERADRLPPRGLARPMLQLAAVLDSHGIPDAVMTSAPALRHLAARRTAPPEAATSGTPAAPPTAGGLLSAADAVAALRALHRLSLVQHTPDQSATAVRVHQLVQRTTWETLSPDEQGLLARTGADALQAVWPEIDSANALVQMLRANAAAVDRIAGRALLTTDIHGVLFRAGKSLGSTGQVAAAHDYFDDLYARAVRFLGPDHPDTLVARGELAHFRGRTGDAAGAVDAFAGLLADQLRVLGPDDPRTLSVRHNLAGLRGEVGDAAGAVEAFAELLADQVRVLGPDHTETLFARGNLASWRGEAGDVAGAVGAFAELLPDLVRVLGSDHPETLITRRELAYCQGVAGDVTGAAAALVELLTDQERVLGRDHPDALVARNNLALFRGRAGDAAGAATAFAELLTDQVRVLGPDHLDCLLTHGNLARWRGEAGDAAGAAAAFAEVLADRLRVLGPDHPGTLAARGGLAQWRGEAGDGAGAAELLAALLADQKRILGPDHPGTLLIRHRLAVWTRATGDLDGAIDAADSLLADLERVLGPEHPETRSTRDALASWRAAAGTGSGGAPASGG